MAGDKWPSPKNFAPVFESENHRNRYKELSELIPDMKEEEIFDWAKEGTEMSLYQARDALAYFKLVEWYNNDRDEVDEDLNGVGGDAFRAYHLRRLPRQNDFIMNVQEATNLSKDNILVIQRDMVNRYGREYRYDSQLAIKHYKSEEKKPMRIEDVVPRTVEDSATSASAWEKTFMEWTQVGLDVARIWAKAWGVDNAIKVYFNRMEETGDNRPPPANAPSYSKYAQTPPFPRVGAVKIVPSTGTTSATPVDPIDAQIDSANDAGAGAVSGETDVKYDIPEGVKIEDLTDAQLSWYKKRSS